MPNFSLFGMQIPPTATPSAAEVAEVLDKAEQVIDIWNSLGPLMAVLLFGALAMVVVLVVVYSNRGSASAAITVLAKHSDRQDKDITDLKERNQLEREQNQASLKMIGEQMARSNDLWEANNTQVGQRAMQQQRMVEVTGQIATDLKTIATTGSPSVQEIKTKVGEIFGIVTGIKADTADWNGILNVITPLLVELGALRAEAKKHSTQPIPAIDPSASNGIVIEGTISGTVIEGDST